MAVAQLFLVEMTVRTDAAGTLSTLRYATAAFTTGPAETPANTPYLDRIKQPCDMVRDLFAGLATMGAARVGYGDIVLTNLDGALDALIDYGFDGGPVTVRQGDLGAAYPGGFTTVFVGTMEQPVFDPDSITIKLRDRILETQVPLQTTKYLGNNALPAGLEGVATDLKDKPKPVCLGVVRNISPPCVNTSKLLFQVHDGPVASIVVRDSGILLAGGSWATASTFANFHEVWGCCYSAALGLYVAVGYDTTALLSRVSTSPDGVNWTVRSSAVTEQNLIKWYTVAWSPSLSLFVAAGTSGLLITSADGVTWANQTSGFAGIRIIGVTWASGPALFVAVGVGGVITTSANGTAWTARTSTVGTDLNAVTYGNGLVVAAGSSGVVLTSPDGITWSSRTNSFGGGTVVRSVTFGQSTAGVGVFVGVGDSGIVITSLDGSTWAIARRTGVTTNLYRVAFAQGVFIAVGQTGTMLLSPNGIDWTARAPGFGTTYVYDLCYGLYGWLIVGDLSKHTMNSIADYANATDLQDDTLAPAPGEIKTYLAGGYFRLGATPAGLITADVTQGAAAANRKPGTMFSTLLTRAGKSAPDWSAADVTAMDALGYILGAWYGPEDTPNVNHVLDFLAQSIGGWWGLDKSGIYRLKQLVAPSGTAVMAITENDIKKKPQRLNTTDPGRGLPVWRVTLKHTKNWTVQTDGVAFGVSDVDRALLALEWQTAKYDTAAVKLKHLLSPELLIETMLTSAANALTEATRIQTLRGTRRDPYEIVVELNSETVALDLGSVVDWAYAPNGITRYGITGPKKMLVLGVQPNAAKREATVTLWG